MGERWLRSTPPTHLAEEMTFCDDDSITIPKRVGIQTDFTCHGKGREDDGSGRNERKDSWQMLRTLKHKSNLPWCRVEDFNDMLSQPDKRGRIAHPLPLIQGFREDIEVEECDPKEINMVGYPYSWKRSRQGRFT